MRFPPNKTAKFKFFPLISKKIKIKMKEGLFSYRVLSCICILQLLLILSQEGSICIFQITFLFKIAYLAILSLILELEYTLNTAQNLLLETLLL